MLTRILCRTVQDLSPLSLARSRSQPLREKHSRLLKAESVLVRVELRS